VVITERLLSLGKRARGLNGKPVIFTQPVDRIIIHWIGPFSNQVVSSPWNWWENGSDGRGVQASAHFIVKDREVLQALPLNEVGWHSGDARNRHSIGIEVIPQHNDGSFSEPTKEKLKELIAYIRKTYPEAKLERHFDGVQKKDCPRFYTNVTAMGDGRLPNPAGGEERWIELRNYLDDEGDKNVV
jgi:hypothetical protein